MKYSAVVHTAKLWTVWSQFNIYFLYILYLPNTNCYVTTNMPSEFKANIHSAFFFYSFQMSCNVENRQYCFKYNHHTFLSRGPEWGNGFSQKLYSYPHECIKSERKCAKYASQSDNKVR